MDFCSGTIGHVDHGKTTLTAAITKITIHILFKDIPDNILNNKIYCSNMNILGGNAMPVILI